MAKGKIGGFINRLVMGSEKSEGYARSTLPSNRWELFWDIFKGRFGKLVIVNLLMLLFFLPTIALFVFRYIAVAGYGSFCPYNQPFGVGYQAPINFTGFRESIVFNTNMQLYLFLPIVLAIAAIGIAGGAYVIRNMVWTEGIFVANDFWRGIKQNFLPILFITLLYSVVFYLTALGLSLEDRMLALGEGTRWLLILSKVVLIGFLALFTIMSLHMITMSVTYKVTIWQLLKNSFITTIGLLPQNIFFIFLGIAPFLLMLIGNFFLVIVLLLALIFLFALFMLIWTDYCQWIYDKFMNDKVPGAQKNRGIYEKIKESDAASLRQYKEQMVLASNCALSSRPIKPITDEELKLADLPTNFNRDDIAKLNESRRVLYEDNEKYIEEHKNDAKFQKTEEQLALEKEREDRERRIEEAKRELAKRKKH